MVLKPPVPLLSHLGVKEFLAKALLALGLTAATPLAPQSSLEAPSCSFSLDLRVKTLAPVLLDGRWRHP